MRSKSFHKGVFAVAAGYDLILGLLFFLFHTTIYSFFSIQLPENAAYLQMSAAFVFVQGVGYFFVYRNLERNIDLVKVGIVYKLIYIGVTFYYWAIGMLPHPMFSLFGFCDLVFVVLFTLYLKDYASVITQKAQRP